mmetsp:Transcript_114073/g.368513  ORF Transcript_114073/g.368513 Transcript_114073/m.368513 type:complete len:169 (+) Transcript_114073:583-1089(+)
MKLAALLVGQRLAGRELLRRAHVVDAHDPREGVSVADDEHLGLRLWPANDAGNVVLSSTGLERAAEAAVPAIFCETMCSSMESVAEACDVRAMSSMPRTTSRMLSADVLRQKEPFRGTSSSSSSPQPCRCSCCPCCGRGCAADAPSADRSRNSGPCRALRPTADTRGR